MTLLLDSAIKMSVLVIVALAGCALLRRQSAALRHWILSAAIVCGAAIPLLSMIAPSWQLAIIPPATRSIVETATPRTDRAASSRIERTTQIAAMAVQAPAATTTAARLGYLWIAGVAISMCLLLVGFIRLTLLASRARLVDGPSRVLADRLARESGLHRPMTLLQSAHPTLVITWGLLHPKVLLPASASTWTEDRLRIVLCHEIAHIRRADWVVQLFAEFVRAFYWFNPLAWLASRQLRREGEQAADDAVLASGVEASEYAAELLDLARSFTADTRTLCAAPAMARPSSLERRITAMLDARLDRTPLSGLSRLGIVGVALMLAVVVAGSARGQNVSATFSATVMDPSGAPLPDTTVTLTHRQSGTAHAAPTDQAGYIEFRGLAEGDYAFEARARGFQPSEDTITLSAGERVQRDLRLNIGTVSETVVVESPAKPAPSEGAKPKAEPKRSSGGDSRVRLQPPIKVTHHSPEYSPALATAGVEGRVLLEGRITSDGRMAGLKVISAPHADLASAAMDAVSRWQFEPTRLWGSPIETMIKITVDFKSQK